MTKKYFLGFVHNPKIFSLVKKPEDIQKKRSGNQRNVVISALIT